MIDNEMRRKEAMSVAALAHSIERHMLAVSDGLRRGEELDYKTVGIVDVLLDRAKTLSDSVKFGEYVSGNA